MPIRAQWPGGGTNDRDAFPFEQADEPDPMIYPHDNYVILGPFTRDEFVELVWRVRNMQVVYNYTNTLGTFAGTYDIANNAGVLGSLPPGSEEDILAQQGNYGSIFDLDGVNPVPGDNTYVGGSWAIYTYEAGEFYCWFRMYAGGANSYSNGAFGYGVSAVTASFLGYPITLFDTAADPHTGTIDVIPHPSVVAYWGWDGHFDTTTGAPL